MSIRSPNALCRAVLQPFRQILPRGGRMIERISSLPTARSPPAPALNPPQSRTLNTRALPPVPSPERSVPSSPPGPQPRRMNSMGTKQLHCRHFFFFITLDTGPKRPSSLESSADLTGH